MDEGVSGTITYDTLAEVLKYNLDHQLQCIVAYLSAPNEDGTPCSVDRQILANRVQKEFGG